MDKEYTSIVIRYDSLDRPIEEIEREITIPLERIFEDIVAIEEINSSTSSETVQITLQFSQSKDLKITTESIRNVLAKSELKLPAYAPEPSVFEVIEENDSDCN